jgi:hypothetical protein
MCFVISNDLHHADNQCDSARVSHLMLNIVLVHVTLELRAQRQHVVLR